MGLSWSLWYGKVPRDSKRRIENEVPTFRFLSMGSCPILILWINIADILSIAGL